MAGDVISCEVSGGVADVVMRMPPVNALAVSDLHALRDLFRATAARADVSAVVLRADGRGFNAGLDFKEMQGPHGNEILLEAGTACRDTLAALTACPVPVVVAVHGYCMGIGIGIVASCDIVVAAHQARFGLPEGSWSIAHLGRLVPPMRLRQMALTCEPITAEELHRIGTVYRVVQRRDLAAEALGIAAALCSQGRASLVATKARLNIADSSDRDGPFAREQTITGSGPFGLTPQTAASGTAD